MLRAHVELSEVGGQVEVRSGREAVEAGKAEDLKVSSVATVLLCEGNKNTWQP